MAQDFDLHVAAAAAIESTAGAWRFLRGFAAHYAGPIADTDGCAEAELDAAEERLGRPLPAALRTGYALIGKRADLTHAQDELLAPATLQFDADVLTFRRENQNVTEWGIPAAHLDEPDPPVVYRLCPAPADSPEWAPWLDRVSLAFVEMALAEWMLGDDENGATDNRDLDGSAVASLEKHFQRLPFPDYPLWADANGHPVRWFTDDAGTLLCDHATTWLWIRSRTPDGAEAVRRILPGEWLMTEP